MIKSYIPTVLVLFLLPAWVLAQEATIQGSVSDVDGNPLTGANVIIEGTSMGASVDIEGNYTFTVPADQVQGQTVTVIARFVSYRTQREQIELSPGTHTLDFTLRDDLLQLDEVVVTGQGGTTERRKLSANVDVIGSDRIEQATVTSIDQLLQGQIAGGQVRATSAQPGSAGLINFRGITSFTGSQTPVIYVDGVRMDNRTGMGFGTGGEQTSALADILVSDVERIEVTKGGAASTLYGADAAAGVIQIFTKRGQPGEPRLQIRTEQGFDRPETKYIKDAGFAFPGLVEDGANPNFVKDEFLRNGQFQNYHVGLSGGDSDNNLTYNVSGRIQNSEGVQPKNENSIYALRGSLRMLLAERFTADFSAGYTRSNFGRIFNGTAISDPLTALEVGDALFFSGTGTLEEALDVFLLPDIDETIDRFTLSSTFRYNPRENFQNQFTFGVDSRASEQRIFEPINFNVTDDEGRLDRYNRDYAVFSLEYRGNLNHTISEWVTSELSFGVQGFREVESEIFATGRNFSLPGVKDFSAAADITASENRSQIFNGGFYVDEKLGFWDRLFLDLGIRVDGNSAFGADIGLQAFPKAGVAYNMSDEIFWRDTFGSTISNFRLRASYGQTGSFPDPFTRDLTFSATPFRGESAPRFSNPGNPDLRPERTETFEAGFDIAFLDDLIGINVTGFYSVTSDALLPVIEQPSTGRLSQLRNVAELENLGIELEWSARLLSRQNLVIDLGGNFQTFRNEVTDMGGVAPFGIGSGSYQRVEVGHPIGEYYVTHPFDSNDDGLNDSSREEYTGYTPYPTSSGSVNLQVQFLENFSLNTMAEWATGHQVLDYGAAWAQFNGLNRVEFPTQYDEDGNDLGEYFYVDSIVSLLQPGDYLKIRNISLRYQVPVTFLSGLGVRSASLALSVRNPFIFSETDLLDPELHGVAGAGELQLGGITSITMPAPQQYRLTVQFEI